MAGRRLHRLIIGPWPLGSRMQEVELKLSDPSFCREAALAFARLGLINKKSFTRSPTDGGISNMC
jgi:hypothetical protein